MAEIHKRQQCCIMQASRDKCQSAEGRLCVVTARIVVVGRPAGELCVCVCVCVYMLLNGMGIEGLRNVGVSGHRFMRMRLCV